MLGSNDYSGNLEPGAPPHRLFAGIDYAAPFGLRSSATVRWVDEFPHQRQRPYDPNDPAPTNWAYTVVDLRFGWESRWGDVDVRPFVGIDNLLNERYNSSAITNGVRPPVLRTVAGPGDLRRDHVRRRGAVGPIPASRFA